MLSKQAENKCPKNGDQHPCTLERARSSSFFRLSSSSFCHRWRRETDPNLCNPRLIEINSGGGRQTYSHKFFSTWLDLTVTKQRSGQRNLFHDDDTISTSMSSSGNLNLHVIASRKLMTPCRHFLHRSLHEETQSTLSLRCCQRGEAGNKYLIPRNTA
jgi:hypothetical protein